MSLDVVFVFYIVRLHKLLSYICKTLNTLYVYGVRTTFRTVFNNTQKQKDSATRIII